jgi:hypothetical protein
MPNGHFVLNIKNYPLPFFPFHIVFPHIKALKNFSHCVPSLESYQSFVIFICIQFRCFVLRELRVFFLEFLPQCEFFFSFLLACSCAYFTCWPHMFILFACFISLVNLLCLPCVLGCLPPLPICRLCTLSLAFVAYLLFHLPHVLTLCACSCLLCLLLVLASLAHSVTCFMWCFATYSHLRHCCCLFLLAFACITTYFCLFCLLCLFRHLFMLAHACFAPTTLLASLLVL